MNFLIDPSNVTNHDQSQSELELFILFWVAVAGKNGHTAARCLSRLLSDWSREASKYYRRPSPFAVVRYIDRHADLPAEMKSCGIGCYNQKARTFQALANSGLNLKKCTLDELEAIPGIGPKTARCFLLHSRPNQPYAGLDVHVVRFLGDLGYEVRSGTPSGNRYRVLEKAFLAVCDGMKISPAELDLRVWNIYSNGDLEGRKKLVAAAKIRSLSTFRRSKLFTRLAG